MDTGPFPTAPSGGIVPPVPARDTGAWLAAEDMDAVAAQCLAWLDGPRTTHIVVTANASPAGRGGSCACATA